jgi:mRNA-degrading endonuclease HigB of HigAB toxin-antitoxin module
MFPPVVNLVKPPRVASEQRAVKYDFQILYIRFIGIHAEYAKIKAE